jgi:hypothetical protein
VAEQRHFPFVQFDLPGRLGPADGRYLLHEEGGDEPEAVVVLRTHGDQPRPPGGLTRLLRRRPRRVRGVGPPPAAGVRATLVHAGPTDANDDPSQRLARLRSDRDALAAEVAWAVAALNRVLRAHRSAARDPGVPQVSAERALAARVGYGTGDQVAEGKFEEAFEVPPARPPRRREALEPEDRLAAILSGQERPLAAEELVMRARLDLDAGRTREAALQARIALEALLAELGPDGLGPLADGLEADRGPVADAANAALAGEPPAPAREAVAAAVARMERAVRRGRGAGA